MCAGRRCTGDRPSSPRPATQELKSTEATLIAVNHCLYILQCRKTREYRKSRVDRASKGLLFPEGQNQVSLEINLSISVTIKQHQRLTVVMKSLKLVELSEEGVSLRKEPVHHCRFLRHFDDHRRRNVPAERKRRSWIRILKSSDRILDHSAKFGLRLAPGT